MLSVLTICVLRRCRIFYFGIKLRVKFRFIDGNTHNVFRNLGYLLTKPILHQAFGRQSVSLSRSKDELSLFIQFSKMEYIEMVNNGVTDLVVSVLIGVMSY